jgi:hypothetical protein
MAKTLVLTDDQFDILKEQLAYSANNGGCDDLDEAEAWTLQELESVIFKVEDQPSDG